MEGPCAFGWLSHTGLGSHLLPLLFMLIKSHSGTLDPRILVSKCKQVNPGWQRPVLSPWPSLPTGGRGCPQQNFHFIP